MVVAPRFIWPRFVLIERNDLQTVTLKKPLFEAIQLVWTAL
jgi:hypothetical protein